MLSQLKVEVRWRHLDDDDEGWQERGCLYAYLAPITSEILYIGKAWGITVRERWRRPAKEGFWNDLETQRGITKHISILGEIWLTEGTRLTHQLIMDIESLLIQQVLPWGNIQCRDLRISRAGMVVQCSGDWPHQRKLFRDQ